MCNSTVTFSNDEQRQVMLKQISMKISELKETDSERNSGEPNNVKIKSSIDKLTEFKHFFDVKGTLTISMSDIVALRALLDREY